jgi:hypothetical protein
MFAENVKICTGAQVRPTIGDDDPSMHYYTVLCATCQTNVGVIDSDEVYHFHHVLEAAAI